MSLGTSSIQRECPKILFSITISQLPWVGELSYTASSRPQQLHCGSRVHGNEPNVLPSTSMRGYIASDLSEMWFLVSCHLFILTSFIFL